ncbi:MAG: hypothetical protein JO062_16625 [Bryobacterales bacterium]|nr:hypothetical protein [Bryobacterales bacterium]
MLRSETITGHDGFGAPMSDVRVVVVAGSRVIANYGTPRRRSPKADRPGLYIDAYLDIADVTGNAVPEILFHSGFQAVSDSTTYDHILSYNAASHTFSDISREEFYTSGTHGLRWTAVAGRSLLVTADRNWNPATPAEARCHYCASPFEYRAYMWNRASRSWVEERKVSGAKSYSEAYEALDGDWDLVRSGIVTSK